MRFWRWLAVVAVACFGVAIQSVQVAHAANPPPNTWICSTDDQNCSVQKILTPMPTARADLASAADAGLMYEIGGFTTTNVDYVEVYNPSTNTWRCSTDDTNCTLAQRTITPLPTARADLGAVVGQDGRIYVIGGGYDYVEAYDPSTNRWYCSTDDADINHHCTSKTMVPEPTARIDTSQLGLTPSGAVFVAGGSVGTSDVDYVEEYFPQYNQWSCSTDDPDTNHHCVSKTLTPMPHARDDMAVVTYFGQIYVFGGYSRALSAGTSYFEVYNPATNKWNCSGTDSPDTHCTSYTLANMPHVHGDGRATYSGARIYVIGSSLPVSQQVDVYDPTGNVWSALANMPTKRGDEGVATAPNGTLYVFGGFGYPNNSIPIPAGLDYVEAYTLVPVNSVCGSFYCPAIDVHFSDQFTNVSSKDHFQTYSTGAVSGFISWRDMGAGALIIPTCYTTFTLCKTVVTSFACTGNGAAQVYGTWTYAAVSHPFTLTMQDNDSFAGGFESEGVDTVNFQTTDMHGNPYAYTETSYAIVDVLCP